MNWYKKARTDILDCDDCGQTTVREYYMLKDEIWNTVADKNTSLCVDCMEKRLGRQLIPSDFMPIPLNFWHTMKRFKSPKLIDRLGL